MNDEFVDALAKAHEVQTGRHLGTQAVVASLMSALMAWKPDLLPVFRTYLDGCQAAAFNQINDLFEDAALARSAAAQEIELARDLAASAAALRG